MTLNSRRTCQPRSACLSRSLTAVLGSIAALTLGCGGHHKDPVASPEFLVNLPNAEMASLDQHHNDEALAGITAFIAEPTAQDVQALTGASCNPHLFLRARDAVKALNRYILGKFFRRLNAVTNSTPHAATSSAVTWIKSVDNGAAQFRVTMTKLAQGQYSLRVEAKSPPNAPDSSYTVIQTAGVNNPSGQIHRGSGTMHFDLTKLGSVITTERARGTIDLHYALNGDNKKIRVTLSGFTGDDGRVHQPPANSNYVFARTKGVGGSFKAVQKTVFSCPENPRNVQAALEAVHRWKISSTSVSGRTDGQATGGRITPGQKWVGAACSDESTSLGTGRSEAAAEKYWQMALFGGTGDPATGGGTLVRGELDSTGPAATTCDPSFGTLPGGAPQFLSNYSFTNIHFGDDSVVPFPGMPGSFP